MFRRMPGIITVLVAAMMVGMIAHGIELFHTVEGGDWYGWVKALGFSLAFEAGNAVGLYVGFNHRTRDFMTRWVALAIGTFCFITSLIIQIHYFHNKIEYAWWYSLVLPGLVALLSALTGLLDRDKVVEEENPNLTQVAPQPQINTAEIAAQVSRSLESQIAEQINLAVQGVKTDLTRRIDAVAAEVGHRIAPTPAQVAPQPKTETAPQSVTNPVETALKETAHAFAAAPVPVSVGAASTGAADSGHDPVLEEVQAKARELELPDPAKLSLAEQEEWAYRLKNEYNWYNHQIGKWLGVSENTAKKRWQDYQKRTQQ